MVGKIKNKIHFPRTPEILIEVKVHISQGAVITTCYHRIQMSRSNLENVQHAWATKSLNSPSIDIC